MKFSYNWLRELLDGLPVDAQALSQLITMKTAESEGVEPYGAHMQAVCVARVESCEPLPGSHNRKAVVETGRYGRRTVVCGAPNCREGLMTAYVPAGTALGGKAIGRISVEGIESDGMLASGAELGVNRDHEGVLELAGSPGDAILGCAPDGIIEIDNKSLTHRPDLWGHFGMAREVAAITGVRLQDPVKLERIPAEACPYRIEIEDLTLCPRYSALVFENVTVQPSPAWLQYRLEAIGLNPINNIVDVTNWILAELAQPMHAFDAGLLHGDTIFIRRATQGEWIVALNEETYKLDAQAQVIADEKGPIALAGVIGGLDSAIHEGTKRVVLESANFQASNIRKTSSRLKLRTDASMRFEKAQDPANTVRGIARAIELFEMVSPGIRIVGGLGDVRREEKPAPRIELPVKWVERKLGRPLDGELITRILRSLEFGVREAKAGVLSVSVPSWRATKDIAIKDDLVEEVGRMVGYDSITPSAPFVAAAVPAENPERTYLRSVRALMAAEGFTEVYNYSFVSDDLVSRFDLEPSGHVAIANPIASDQNYMRTSLIPNIWRNLENNSRHFETFRLFEIGREIHKQAGEELPREVTHLVAAMYARHAEDAGLYELKRVAECLLPGARVAPTEARSYEHPARAAEVIWQDRAVGRLFELHPRMLTGRAAILDIDLALVESLQPAVRKYQPIRRYPSSGFDLSVIVRTRELVGEVQDRLARATGTELESIEFLRQYAGPPIEEGFRSVSYRITVASPDHTLSLEEVGHIRARIIEDMRAAGYELRV